MSKNDFHAEKMYLLCVGRLQKMLELNIITEDEYAEIDTILLNKYKPSLSALLSGKDLIKFGL